MYRIIITLFVSGLLFGSGPCLASCGPVLITYIAGTKKGIAASLKAYILFSCARIGVYIALAVVVFFLGEFVMQNLSRQYARYVIITAGIFMLLLGSAMILARQKEPAFCRYVLGQGRKNEIILGLLFGLLPCGPLLAILSYIGLVSKSWLNSSLYALVFGLGTFTSPLVLLAVLAGLAPKIISRQKEAYARIFSAVCGLIIIILGINLIRKGF
jgi:sulfite exporter TauE/SafE